MTPIKRLHVIQDLARAINIHSLENDGNTPDFVLAEVALKAIEAFNEATHQRDAWYGIEPEPGNPYGRRKDGK